MSASGKHPLMVADIPKKPGVSTSVRDIKFWHSVTACFISLLDKVMVGLERRLTLEVRREESQG